MPGIMEMPDNGNIDVNARRCFFMPMPINDNKLNIEDVQLVEVSTSELDYNNVIDLKNDNYFSNAKAMSYAGWGNGYGFETTNPLPENGYVRLRIGISENGKGLVCYKKPVDSDIFDKFAGTYPSANINAGGTYPLSFSVNKGDHFKFIALTATGVNKVSIASAIFVPYKKIKVLALKSNILS